MDTFNFSFFDDKQQDSDKDAGNTSPPTNAASENEVKPAPEAEADDDPFGFNAFSLDNAEEDSDTATPKTNDLSFELPAAEETETQLASEDAFDLSSFAEPTAPQPTASVLPANRAAMSDTFPSLALEPEEPTIAESTVDDLSSFSLDAENAPNDLDSFNFNLDDVETPATDNTETDTSETVTSPELDTFASLESEHLEEIESADITPAASSFDLDSLSDAPASEPKEPTAPEVATVLAPVNTDEVRASVTPAVFLTPAESSVPASELAEPKAKTKPSRFLTTDDPYGEVAPPRERLRVAILGASGIGKNHARWFARHSCDVVSFLGSSDESVDLTRSHLQAHMGFSGQGYTDLGQLLSETKPQAVCIASPPYLHYAQAMQCLEAGIHVLCEKPLVYTATRTRRENMDGAKELLKAAAKRDLVLATQLQYGAATSILCRLAGVSPFEVGDFAMEIETTNPRAPRDSKLLWIELAPHPLAVAQYLAGDGAEIVQETLQIIPSRSAYTSEVTARFGVRSAEGRLVMCRVIVRWFDKIVDNREPRRRFSFNGRVVQYSGVKSPDGTYIAQYVAPDGYISHYSDPVDYLIGNFVRTCWEEDELIFSAEQGVQNLDWLLTTADKI